MRKLVALVLIVMVFSFTPEETSAARVHSWTAEVKTSIKECHDRTCKRLVHVQPGQTVQVTRYWDNWGFATDGQQSGWINLSVFDRAARPDKMKRCYDTTFNYTACAPDWISEAITHEAARYKIPRNLMMQVAACESDFDPTVIGAAGEIGIFQWKASSWDTPKIVGDIHDTWNQATNTAKFISMGYQHWWTCWTRITGGKR